MDDLISRQAAIEALKGCYCGGEDSCGEPWIYEDHAIKAIEQLPSAQSESFEWCTDCKEYDQEKHCCPRWNKVIKNTLVEVEREKRVKT